MRQITVKKKHTKNNAHILVKKVNITDVYTARYSSKTMNNNQTIYHHRLHCTPVFSDSVLHICQRPTHIVNHSIAFHLTYVYGFYIAFGTWLFPYYNMMLTFLWLFCFETGVFFYCSLDMNMKICIRTAQNMT